MIFDEAELRAAMEGANEPRSPNSITTPELAAHLGIGEAKARKVLRSLIEQGKIEPARVWRENMAGVRQRVQGYVLK